jgi:RNA polymerase sigma-70 factor (ECF subfamily)
VTQTSSAASHLGYESALRSDRFLAKKDVRQWEYIHEFDAIAMLSWNSMTSDLEGESAHVDDLRVVAMIASGDKGALAQLYDRYASVLTGLGMKILKDKNEVESLLHDVFVDVWQNAGSYDPDRGTVKTWLCLRMRSHGLERSRVGGSEMADFLTEPGIGPSVPLAMATPSPDDPEMPPGLDTLSAAERRVISMMYFRGLSCREIAANLKVPVATVKDRLAGARKGLERAMMSATGASA